MGNLLSPDTNTRTRWRTYTNTHKQTLSLSLTHTHTHTPTHTHTHTHTCARMLYRPMSSVYTFPPNCKLLCLNIRGMLLIGFTRRHDRESGCFLKLFCRPESISE